MMRNALELASCRGSTMASIPWRAHLFAARHELPEQLLQ
jgi:hypothetical protein